MPERVIIAMEQNAKPWPRALGTREGDRLRKEPSLRSANHRVGRFRNRPNLLPIMQGR